MLLKSSQIGDFSSRFSRKFVGIAGNHREIISKSLQNIQKFANSKENPVNFCKFEIFDTKFW